MDELLDEIILYIDEDYDSKQEDLVLSMIDSAIDEIVSAMCPFDLSDDAYDKAREKAIKRYKNKITAIVKYHYDKRGIEGVIGWSENNVSAQYENSGTPKSYFSGIIPMTRII